VITQRLWHALVLGAGFLANAAWIGVPDTVDAEHEPLERFGVLGTT